MIDIIFKSKTHFDANPNNLMPINGDYNYKDSFCAFGDLSKTNIFIGENNSGKSRFLRYLFENNFYTTNYQQFDKFFAIFKKDCFGHYDIVPKSNMENFNRIYEKIGDENSGYTNVGNRFFTALKSHSTSCEISNKFYFPILRGDKRL